MLYAIFGGLTNIEGEFDSRLSVPDRKCLKLCGLDDRGLHPTITSLATSFDALAIQAQRQNVPSECAALSKLTRPSADDGPDLTGGSFPLPS